MKPVCIVEVLAPVFAVAFVVLISKFGSASHSFQPTLMAALLLLFHS